MTARKVSDHTLGVTNACSSGKRAHVNRRDAKAHARAVRERTGEHLRPYSCPECHLWHVGHIPVQVLRGRTTVAQHYGRAAS